MKKSLFLVLCALAFNIYANDPSPIPGLTVSDSRITWSNRQGWMQVQDAENFAVVEGCEGQIITCAVTNGRVYLVTDHTNNWKSTNVRASVGDVAPESSSTCKAQYSFPEDDAWYQLQEKNTYSTVCKTSGTAALAPPCSLDPGTYQLVEFRSGTISAADTEVRCDVPTSSISTISPNSSANSVSSSGSLDTTEFTNFPIATGVGYGSFRNTTWQTMMRNASMIWAGSTSNIRTANVNGRKAQIHRMNPTPTSRNGGTDRVNGAFNISRRTEATLVQWVRMEPNYAMGRKQQGGKWGFGLVGGSVPTGGSSATDGFSIRLAPYGDLSQPDTKSEVGMHLYVYSADKVNRRYGDELPLIDPKTNQTFVMPRDGSWVQFAMYAKMNSSVGARDGILRGYVNGVLMLEQTGKQWYSSGKSGSPHIDQILVNTFMGGNSGAWAPSKANEIMFSDISLGFSDK